MKHTYKQNKVQHSDAHVSYKMNVFPASMRRHSPPTRPGNELKYKNLYQRMHMHIPQIHVHIHEYMLHTFPLFLFQAVFSPSRYSSAQLSRMTHSPKYLFFKSCSVTSGSSSSRTHWFRARKARVAAKEKKRKGGREGKEKDIMYAEWW